MLSAPLVKVDLGGKQIWIKGFAYTSKFRCLPSTAEAIAKKVLEKQRPRIPRIPDAITRLKKRMARA